MESGNLLQREMKSQGENILHNKRILCYNGQEGYLNIQGKPKMCQWKNREGIDIGCIENHVAGQSMHNYNSLREG